MRLRRLAPLGLTAGAFALLFSFAPAQAVAEIQGSIEVGHPANQVGFGYDLTEHPCQELTNDDGTPNYHGTDGVWIDLRGAPEGTPVSAAPDLTLDIDVYFYALEDQNEDGEVDCVLIDDTAMAQGWPGDAEGGKVLPGAKFIFVDGFAGHGNFTVKIG